MLNHKTKSVLRFVIKHLCTNRLIYSTSYASVSFSLIIHLYWLSPSDALQLSLSEGDSVYSTTSTATVRPRYSGVEWPPQASDGLARGHAEGLRALCPETVAASWDKPSGCAAFTGRAYMTRKVRPRPYILDSSSYCYVCSTHLDFDTFSILFTLLLNSLLFTCACFELEMLVVLYFVPPFSLP